MAKMYPGMHSTEQEPTAPHGEKIFPNSGGKSLDKAGIHTDGFIDNKGTLSGLDARFNFLPPGMDIGDQKNTDQREQAMKMWSGGLSYPGDGWT